MSSKRNIAMSKRIFITNMCGGALKDIIRFCHFLACRDLNLDRTSELWNRQSYSFLQMLSRRQHPVKDTEVPLS